MRSAVVLILIMLMGGCITSSTAKHYFQLSPPASSVGKIGEIPAVLLIDTIACDEIYDDFRIVYRLSDFELNYYNDDFWVKKPPVMIRKFIRRFFEQQHIFVRIVDDLAEDEPDIVLKSSLRVLEEVDGPDRWWGRLALELRFEDYQSGDVILSYSFDRRKQLEKNSVALLPAAISRILTNELTRVCRQLAERVDTLLESE